MSVEQTLPIESIKSSFFSAAKNGPVVITSPTGSGKSTAVPRWWATLGRVLVIEPRRVACRGLAEWVSTLENTSLGEGVGYAVRDDPRYQEQTQIVFATPGVVLRWMSDGRPLNFDGIIIDEFHERSLDVDLLFALLRKQFQNRLTVMSATMEAERLASHLKGTLLSAKVRRFPVKKIYIPGKTLLPDTRGLTDRLDKALQMVSQNTGDILVFLPGKAEIASLAGHLEKQRIFEVLQIHGGLTLEEQSRVFKPGKHQRVILATNVAETSITIPNIGTVIDSGLVRRTRYVNGRGYLTLVPIAMDSANQRAGRAGRLQEGTCFRLWSKEANLAPTTPPEIFRESLSPMLLAAAACNAKIDDLPFLDAPKPFAVESAQADLIALGAIDEHANISKRGRRLFGLPLDPALGSLLVEAKKEGCIDEAIDLVSVLGVGRPLFTGTKRPSDEANDLRIDGCDAISHIRAIRMGKPAKHGPNPFVLKEARRIRRRLRSAWSLPEKNERTVNRDALVKAALRADTRCAYVARRRKGRVFWANGGTEISLSKESAVDDEKTNAMAVMASMAIGMSQVDARIIATCAMPVTFRQLTEAGLGKETVAHASKEKSTVLAKISRIYAGAVIDTREEVPIGALARHAIATLFLEGRIYKASLTQTRNNLEAAALARRVAHSQATNHNLDLGDWEIDTPIPTIEEWIHQQLSVLGVESGDDLGLLSNKDLIAPDLPEHTREILDREFPQKLSLGDVKYDIVYDLKKREATLVMTEGKRKNPPPITTLPALRGFRIRAKHHSKVWVLRER